MPLGTQINGCRLILPTATGFLSNIILDNTFDKFHTFVWKIDYDFYIFTKLPFCDVFYCEYELSIISIGHSFLYQTILIWGGINLNNWSVLKQWLMDTPRCISNRFCWNVGWFGSSGGVCLIKIYAKINIVKRISKRDYWRGFHWINQ